MASTLMGAGRTGVGAAAASGGQTGRIADAPRTDVVIASFAAKQHGIVTRIQLIDAGISRHIVDRRVKRGLLRPVHAGVYQMGPVVAPRAREMAAVLACKRAAVSHRSAAALRKWITEQRATEPVDLTLPGGLRCGRRPGIRAHRSDAALEQIRRIDGVPVTSAARTLLDLSRVATARELEQALARAERDRAAVRTELASLLDRYAGRAGTRLLADLVEASAAPALTRSEAEELLRDLIISGGLPEPETNVVIHGFEVDCLWRPARIVVEVDGYAYHSSRGAFVQDRKRDSALAAAGIHVLRLSWHQLTEERDRTLVQLAQALATRR
jgi:very-short-patch-repair endonuclease/predicted transcriptional regulator of viral defense system